MMVSTNARRAKSKTLLGLIESGFGEGISANLTPVDYKTSQYSRDATSAHSLQPSV